MASTQRPVASLSRAVPQSTDPDIPVRLMHGPKTLLSLPDDVMLEIIAFIRVNDVLSLRQTCKKLCKLTKSRWVWANAMRQHVIQKGLPIPASISGLKSLSAAHLEARVVHAAKVHDNWYSAHPKPRQAIEFQARCMIDEADGTPAHPVSQVAFMHARSGEFLLVVAGTRLTCWEVPLDGSGAYEVMCVHKNGLFIQQVVVNQDAHQGRGEFAFWARRWGEDGTAKLYIASLDTFRGRIEVKMSCSVPLQIGSPLHLMDGNFLLSGCPPVLWFLATHPKKPNRVLLNSSVPVEGSNAVLAAKIIGQYVLVAREQELLLFRMPDYSPEDGVKGSASLLATFHLGERACEAVIVTRGELGTSTASPFSKFWTTGTVTVLAHCKDGGPNTLAQYDFVPNLDLRPVPGTKKIFPFIIPPGPTRTIPVAPSFCGLSIRPSGRGYWIQTDNVEANHMRYPARCIMGFDVVSPQQADAISAERDNVLPANHSNDQPQANIVHFCESPLYARRCDMSHILRKRYAFGAVALEDVIGRLAIGDKDGRIEVLDFA